VQRRTRLAVDQQAFTAALGANLDERQRVVVGFAEQERTLALLAAFGLHEDSVDRCNHRLAGAIVGVQAVQPAGSGAAGRQVGVDIGATEGVDRLLGVADHEQASVRVVLADAIDAFENAVLDRVGVLEFVDQRHRELLTDQRSQAFSRLRAQRLLQT